MINTFVILLLFQLVGEVAAHGFGLPIPGPVIGMLLLLLYLMVKQGAAEKLAPTAHGLLRHLSILFVPAGVGVMLHGQRIADEWLPIVAALVLSTVLGMVVTALTVKWLQK
ncbi:CidA/LrgA family protein [Noviherbaspirillum sedimenti]|uniref:CidA/LrgA family protein n=1 Tax=Noviherbaspirillum sedimenti TaxID=2320865 RepID=A0A3A3G2W4_9BURK|nr:CidA/LrgA family protein [Noviherbaspirillum sedimenti]RJG02194.1 CidA/LrgA family protein [Noviherbaspirillum sedimenti]